MHITKNQEDREKGINFKHLQTTQQCYKNKTKPTQKLPTKHNS